MHQTIDIVKRRGARESESFASNKLHASIVAACLSVKTPVGQAEIIATAVTQSVIAWMQTKPEITSHDVRRVAASHLHTHHPDAAYLYEHYHLTI